MESSTSDDDTSSELCTWAEEEAEEEEEGPSDDLYGDVWPPEPSYPSQQDVVVLTSVVASRNQAPGTVWEVLPNAPSVVSLSSVGSSSAESTGASWEEDSQSDLFRAALSECEWHDSEASEGGSAVGDSSDESWILTA